MADTLYHTQDREAHLHEMRIAEIRAKQRELQPRGSCYWCAEVFYPGDARLFCDDDCRDDWHKARKHGR